jgi:type I restriction-modification system DNA methylase subunit
MMKKLTNNHIDNNNNNKIENNMSITNKEALKDKIHEIHNLLRNNGAGYGMNALKIFNFFYGLKKIEEKKLLEKINITNPKHKFSYLLSLANKNKDEDLTEIIFDINNEIYNNDNISELLHYDIPSNIKSYIFSKLIKEIDKITCIEKSCNVQLSGKIYEYFIGRDATAITELGAYFTDRHIVNYIYKKLDPSINKEGIINSMIDMFGGSGGFTTGYINYLNNKYPNKIDWNKNLDNVYHYDVNEDVIRYAGLEFFCLTGVLPDMRRLCYKNSFSDEFINDNTNKPDKFKYIITNPPYGGDSIKKSDAMIKREKIREFIKNELKNNNLDEIKIKYRTEQLTELDKLDKQEEINSQTTKLNLKSCSKRINKYSNKHNLKGNDKESCSLILMMDLLDIDGTCIGVLKEGVFFNQTYKDIRKCLIENFNVREIISVPQNAFENTNTKTSIIIFDNTEEKTTKIKFSDLKINKYIDDKFEEINNVITLVENKDDIYSVEDILICEVTKEQLLNNKIISFNPKEYNKQKIICSKDYELKKLGDICKFLLKSKKQASFGQSEGKYNFYTSSDKVKKCDCADYKEECIIVGTGGVANIKLDSNFSCSTDNIILSSKYNNYIYYLLKNNMNLLSYGFNGSTLGHISIEYLKNLEIPIPKTDRKLKEWTDKISKSYDLVNNTLSKIKELEDNIKNKINNIILNEDCDEVELNDIIDTKAGEYITKNKMNNGIYPVYGGGNISNYIDKYNNENELIINKDGVSLNCVKYVHGKFYLNHHGWKLIYKTIYLKSYINFWLFNNQNNIYELAKGSAQKGINKESFLKLKIKIPKNKKLITDLESIFKEIENLQNNKIKYELEYKECIKALSKEAILGYDKNNNILEDDILEDISEDDILKDNSTKRKSKKDILKDNSTKRKSKKDISNDDILES